MTGFWAERLSQSSRYYLSLPRLWILSRPSQAMVSKLAVLGLIHQKALRGQSKKEKCLLLLDLRSSSTILPSPKFTHVRAPNLGGQSMSVSFLGIGQKANWSANLN